MTDSNDVETALHDAFDDHAASIEPTTPPFSELLGAHHRRTRRRLAVATCLVAFVGVAGVAVATSRTDSSVAEDPEPGLLTSDGDPVEPGDGNAPNDRDDVTETPWIPESSLEPVSTTAPAEWFCSGRLGTDADGRALYDNCDPLIEFVDSDWACTEPLGRDDVGRERFRSCTAIGRLGPLPPDYSDVPLPDPDELPGPSWRYTVESGDYPRRVAAEHCVDVEDLAAANGWSDVGTEFPFPGSVMLIPKTTNLDDCDTGRYTITEGDTSRTSVAKKFCVSVQAMDHLNDATPDYSAFYPGLEILIPPTSSSADWCNQ